MSIYWWSALVTIVVAVITIVLKVAEVVPRLKRARQNTIRASSESLSNAGISEVPRPPLHAAPDDILPVPVEITYDHTSIKTPVRPQGRSRKTNDDDIRAWSRALFSQSAEARSLAVEKLGAASAVRELRSGVYSMHPDTRLQAVSELARIGAEEELTSALYSFDPKVRIIAVRGLAEHGYTKGLQAALIVLDINVNKLASDALRTLGC
jgi:HEAT repeat protein